MNPPATAGRQKLDSDLAAGASHLTVLPLKPQQAFEMLLAHAIELFQFLDCPEGRSLPRAPSRRRAAIIVFLRVCSVEMNSKTLTV